MVFNNNPLLFHGTRVMIEIEYTKRVPLFGEEDGVAIEGILYNDVKSKIVGLVQDIRIEENTEVKTESVIGYNGEPAIIIPSKKTYTASISKLVLDDKNDEDISRIMRGWKQGVFRQYGFGNRREYVAFFNLKVYYLTSDVHKGDETKRATVYHLKNCVVTKASREVKYNSYVFDNIDIEFQKLLIEDSDGNLI